MSLRALIWVHGCCTFSYTLWETVDPLSWLPQCLSRSEITALQECVLYLFSHKCPSLSWTSWVNLLQLLVSKPGSLTPGSSQTQHQSSKNCNLSGQIGTQRINCGFGEPIKSSSILKRGHIFLASLAGLKKKWQDPRGLVQQCGAVAVCDCPLNCLYDGWRWLVSTFSL